MMKPENSLVVLFYNPNSGRFSNRKRDRIFRVIRSRFQNAICISDITELSKVVNAHIIALGGDGTFHVAINHADLTSNSFSIFPMGSGNDFVTAFPKRNIVELCNLIEAGKVIKTDLIRSGNIWAHTVTGVGFEALVSQKANESINPIPALKFIIPVARFMFSYKPLDVKVVADNFEFNGKAFMVSMGNGIRAGGGFKLFPKASLFDGKLDLLLIKNPTWYEKLFYVWLVNFGKHLNLDVVHYLQTSQVQITFEGSTPLNADGDVYKTNSFTARVEKEILQVIQ